MRLVLIGLILSFALCPALFAKQLSFNKVKNANSHTFNYVWLDHNQKQQTLAFNLPTKTLLNRYRNFRSYQPKMANNYVNNQLKKYFRKQPIANVSVDFSDINQQIYVRGSDPVAINEAQKVVKIQEKKLFKHYLDKHHYQTFITPSQTLAIKPNHIKIAIDSVGDLKPLKPIILESASIKNIRKVSNYVLGFIQTIPYETLSSRITSSGAGYNPPLKLLWENKGDCDSKVTLTASLLRSLMPRIKIAMIFIDNHALLGIDVPAIGDEVTVNYNGTNYLLAEPTGPALMKLGKIAQSSKQAVLSGHYVIEELHAAVINNSNNSPTETTTF